ncbi:MAG: S-layer protein [Planctomyces sp.]|nr:S-layer protein [Planctomyces sp.]
MNTFHVLNLLIAMSLLAASGAMADEPSAAITALPQTVTLHGQAARHAFLVQRTTGDEVSEQITAGLEFNIANEQVAKIVDGEIVPTGNGETTITITAPVAEGGANSTTEIKVIVTGAEQQKPWMFERHVQSVLTKAGCNSGPCHGALAGKGGFRLSLRGYDSATDYDNIVKQARGRRVELSDPGRSLILAKPSGGIPHKGGLRFNTDSVEYQILSEWVANGATYNPEEEAKIERLEILPERVTLKKGMQQQLIVRAYYSDGTIDDVTRWAKFISANDAVAQVDEHGLVEVVGAGEGAVTALFRSQPAIARITSPYENEVDPALFADAPRQNFVDELVIKQLKRLNLPPSPRANDEIFLRRAYLDTIGTLPTRSEVIDFLNNPAPDKRAMVIDSLLSRPEFVDYWTYKWSDILLLNGTKLRPPALKAYYEWLRGHVANNTPWDAMVREILTAQGSSVENGATNFFALHQEPELMAENASQAFLGLSINCAKCHNHPLEKWTNDQYYAMANLFARVRAKGWGGEGRNGDGHRTLYVATKGDLIQPLTGKPQPPTPLDGEPLEFDDPADRRIHLADWLTAADNPYFARSITNRVWANFMGVGLVESIDDMRVTNPASNEELLAALADHLVANQFNVKELMRVILESEAYQRSSEPLPGNAEETRFYSRYYPRRLMAEVLLDAISQVSDVPDSFNKIEFPGADFEKTEAYPEGTRALQLYDSAVKSYFLKTFGRNQRLITCECERSDEPTMVQVLHLSNGDTINEKLQGENSIVAEILQSDLSNEDIVEQAFLKTLGRFPTDEEQQKLAVYLSEASGEERRLALEDLYWSLMTSREFLFNH